MNRWSWIYIGGGGSYETLLNTYELELITTGSCIWITMQGLGFEGQFYIEPKPKNLQTSIHFDAAAVVAF